MSSNPLQPGTSDTSAPITQVLTREQRDALTAGDVLKRLIDGNERFATGPLTSRNHSKQVRDVSN